MSDTRAEIQALRKLTFGGILTQGVGGFLRNFGPFLQVMAVPLLLSTGERLAYDALRAAGLTVFVSSAIWAIARAPVWTLFGFAWLSHLLGPGRSKHLWRPNWNRAHWGFMVCMLLGLVVPNFAIHQFNFQVVAAVWPEAYWRFGVYLRWLTIFIIFYLYCRFGLAFCALIAERRAGSIRDLIWSWRIGGRAAIKMVLVLLPVIWATSMVRETARAVVAFTPGISAYDWILTPLLVTFLAYINYGVMMAIWAYAYRTLAAGTVPQKDILERFD